MVKQEVRDEWRGEARTHPTPAKIKPFAEPRSGAETQRETNWFEAGNITASAAPSKNRTAINHTRAKLRFEGTAAVSAVKIPQHKTPTVSATRSYPVSKPTSDRLKNGISP